MSSTAAALHLNLRARNHAGGAFHVGRDFGKRKIANALTEIDTDKSASLTFLPKDLPYATLDVNVADDERPDHSFIALSLSVEV